MGPTWVSPMLAPRALLSGMQTAGSDKLLYMSLVYQRHFKKTMSPPSTWNMKGQSEIAYLPKFANIMVIVMVIVITEIL